MVIVDRETLNAAVAGVVSAGLALGVGELLSALGTPGQSLVGSVAGEVVDRTPGSVPSAKDVQRRYREMLRSVHPDHGADADDAARRIAELAEARRILTSR